MTEEDVHLNAIQNRVKEMVAKVRDRNNRLSDHERGQLLPQLFAVMDAWEEAARGGRGDSRGGIGAEGSTF